MNCQRIDSLLASRQDGGIGPDASRELENHLAACPECRRKAQLLDDSLGQLTRFSKEVSIPDAEVEWRRLQLRINETKTESHPWWRTRPALLAATGMAAVVAFTFLNRPSTSTTPRQSAPPTRQVASLTAQAEYVEAGDESATPIVYLDNQSGWLIVWAESGNS